MQNSLFKSKQFLIGMIALDPLCGYSKSPPENIIVQNALSDLDALSSAGFDGVLVENDNDRPHIINVTKNVRQSFIKIAKRVIKRSKIPVGIQILYDMPQTLLVADEVRANFVRLDVFVDDVETKWGKIFAGTDELVKIRSQCKNNFALFTDIHVKHAKILSNNTIEESAIIARQKGSDGVIVSGKLTGIAPSINRLKRVKDMLKDFPVIVGSGTNEQNIIKLARFCDGFIVGTALKKNGRIDFERARRLREIIGQFSK